MPGHISIYVNESRTLIAGDALVIEDKKLAIANPQYTYLKIAIKILLITLSGNLMLKIENIAC